MAIFTKGTKYMKNKMSDVGDGLKGSVNSMSSGFSLWASSHADYKILRASAQSYFTRELLDAKLTKRNFKAMRRAARHLEYYGTPEFEMVFSELFRKYNDDPSRLQKLANKEMKNVVGYLEEFTQTYEYFLRLLSDELLKSKQMILLDDSYLRSLLRKLPGAIERSRAQIPRQIQEDAKKAIKQVLTEQLKSERIGLWEDDSLRKVNYVKTGWLDRMMGIGHIIHKIRKIVKKWEAKELVDFVRVLDSLDSEVQGNRVSAITLARLIRHAKNTTATHRLLAEMTHDVKECLRLAQEQLKSVAKAMSQLMSMFKSLTVVNDIETALQKLRKLEEKAKTEERADYDNTMKLLSEVDRFYRDLSPLFDDIRRKSDSIAEMVANRPELVLGHGFA